MESSKIILVFQNVFIFIFASLSQKSVKIFSLRFSWKFIYSKINVRWKVQNPTRFPIFLHHHLHFSLSYLKTSPKGVKLFFLTFSRKLVHIILFILGWWAQKLYFRSEIFLTSFLPWLFKSHSTISQKNISQILTKIGM